MDPFGRYDRRSSSEELCGHQRSQSAAYGGDRYYGYDQRYRRPPPPYYAHAYRHDGCLGAGYGIDRRSRRRWRNLFLMLFIAALIGFITYRKLCGMDIKGRMAEATIENIIEEVMGKSITRPEMIVPPDAALKVRSKAATVPRVEKERPPTPDDRDLAENDPLDIPLMKEASPIAAEKLANALLSIEEGDSSSSSNGDNGQALQAPPQAHQAHQLQPIADLEKALDLGGSTFKKLNEQIDQLSRKLEVQNKMVEDLQKGLDNRSDGLLTAQSTMGEEMLRQLGIKGGSKTGGTSLKQPHKPNARGEETAEPFARELKFEYPPISTVVCNGIDSVDRVCKIKNLCFDPTHDRFFIFKDTSTLEAYVPKNRTYLVDSSSIDGHNKFFFDYNEVHPDAFRHRTVDIVDRTTFMISRFHALNIMHTIHDDFFGLYGLHRMFAPPHEDDERYPFSRDNNIMFVDSFEKLRYDYVFQFLTDNPLQFRSQLKDLYKGRNKPICFRDAVVGNSKIGSWYSYGFLEPQGPIPNKTVSGLYIRDSARYLMNRMSLPAWDEFNVRTTVQELFLCKMKREREGQPRRSVPKKSSDQMFITVFSRTLDRMIINEVAMINGLEETFGLSVKTVRMEDMHLGQQASILRSTVIAIGIHGSALILSMFLPPGAILIELFPYAVPAENYTPYKTMSNLPGMRLAYRSWTNKKEENNFPHPERPPSGGGIAHLPLAEQEKIKSTLTVPPHLCCRDPYWLYRIYQDTKVDLAELYDTIEDALSSSLKLLDTSPQSYVQIRPGVIDSVRCKVIVPSGVNVKAMTNDTLLDMEISWDEPWNGVIPEKYGIWIHQPYQEFFSNTPSLTPPQCKFGSRYDVWVRSYMSTSGSNDMIKSQYSEKVICHCRPDAKASRDEDL